MRPLVLAVVLLFSLAAHANSVPTFFATKGTALLTPEPVSDMTFVDYSFSGRGFQLSGSGTVGCNFCNGPYPVGFTLDSGVTFFSEGQDGVTIGDTNYFPVSAHGLSTTPDHVFRLPARHRSTLTIRVPVTFAGPLGVCLSQFPDLPGCASEDFATINFNSKGRAKINYIRQGDTWAFSSA